MIYKTLHVKLKIEQDQKSFTFLFFNLVVKFDLCQIYVILRL